MREYDDALNLSLQASTDSALRQITGLSVARWLNVEMHQVSSSLVDLLLARRRTKALFTSSYRAQTMPAWLSA